MDKRNPLTFHTVFKILETYSFLENLNRNRFGPSTANEKGVAKNQDFVKAALTDWLFCVFGISLYQLEEVYLICPTQEEEIPVERVVLPG
jgi:hypothetical protein